jgi:alpha-tubulin suppressor-like RCC1 family protein
LRGTGCALQDGLYVPTKVEALTGIQVTDVACGGWHTVCLAEGGAVFVFGRGEYGRLGLGDDRSRATPVKVTCPARCDMHAMYGERAGMVTMCVWQLASTESIEVVQATTGGTHTMLLSATREIYVMGRGSLGRLGLGTCHVLLNRRERSCPSCSALCVDRKQERQQRTQHHSDWIILGSRSQECKSDRYRWNRIVGNVEKLD